jgi:hypothetical protein
MRKISVLLCAFAGLLTAGDAAIHTPEPVSVPNVKLWRASVTALAAANALDTHSSWGKHELNRTLASPSGNFGTQGALLKLAFQGGLIGLEYLVTRGHPSGKFYRALSIVNFGAAGAIGAVAAHNYTIARPLR